LHESKTHLVRFFFSPPPLQLKLVEANPLDSREADKREEEEQQIASLGTDMAVSSLLDKHSSCCLAGIGIGDDEAPISSVTCGGGGGGGMLLTSCTVGVAGISLDTN